MEALGVASIRKIPAAALPTVLADAGLIDQAKTGSGETVAVGLPFLTIINPPDFGAQGLIL
ncbi:MAG: hypothetical protein P8M73_00425 [Luminiphilus sp.]|nr:hypothetical protein [Luminiphilus sp.]